MYSCFYYYCIFYSSSVARAFMLHSEVEEFFFQMNLLLVTICLATLVCLSNCIAATVVNCVIR